MLSIKGRLRRFTDYRAQGAKAVSEGDNMAAIPVILVRDWSRHSNRDGEKWRGSGYIGKAEPLECTEG